MSAGTAPASAWPLVLAGPMPRRVESEAVSVFVACSRPRTVRLSIYLGTLADPGRLVHSAEGRTLALGASLHVAVVTARPPAPLACGTVYGYDLGFRREAGDPGDDGPAEADLESLGLGGQLGYRPDTCQASSSRPNGWSRSGSSTDPAASPTASAATPWPPSTTSWRPPTPTRRRGPSSCS